MILEKTKTFLENALREFVERSPKDLDESSDLILPVPGQEHNYISSYMHDQTSQRLVAEFARALRLTELNANTYFTILKKIGDRIVPCSTAEELKAYMLSKIEAAEDMCEQEFKDQLDDFERKLRDVKENQADRYALVWQFFAEEFHLNRVLERALQKSKLEQTFPLAKDKTQESEEEKQLAVYQRVWLFFQKYPEAYPNELNELSQLSQMFVQQTQCFIAIDPSSPTSPLRRETIKKYSDRFDEYCTYLFTLRRELQVRLEQSQAVSLNLEKIIAGQKTENNNLKAEFADVLAALQKQRELTHEATVKLQAATTDNTQLTDQLGKLTVGMKAMQLALTESQAFETSSTEICEKQQAYIAALEEQIERLKLTASVQAARTLSFVSNSRVAETNNASQPQQNTLTPAAAIPPGSIPTATQMLRRLSM